MSQQDYTQLCVWPGTNLGGQTAKDFYNFMVEEFEVRTKFEDVLTTGPTIKNGKPVPGTGGRTDLIFYIHSKDIPKFAATRLAYGIRWWEDVLLNGGGVLYSEEILQKYPSTWSEEVEEEDVFSS